GSADNRQRVQQLRSLAQQMNDLNALVTANTRLQVAEHTLAQVLAMGPVDVYQPIANELFDRFRDVPSDLPDPWRPPQVRYTRELGIALAWLRQVDEAGRHGPGVPQQVVEALRSRGLLPE